MADRVDIAEDGTLQVVGYKRGPDRGSGYLGEENSDTRGHKRQRARYGQVERR
jgi:hypothetical protein